MQYVRLWIFSLFTLLANQAAQAQQPIRFLWRNGDVLTYSAQQKTTIEEILLNDATKKLEKGKNVVDLKLTYAWTVTAVDANGTATLQKTVNALRSETTRTTFDKDGKEVVTSDIIDSAKEADQKNMPYLGKVAVVAKVDVFGKIVEAKSDFGEASVNRFKTELPFRMILSDKPFTSDLAWSRDFAIQLDPKYGGTGEEYLAVQMYTSKGLNDKYAVIHLNTKLKNEPKTKIELRPLISLFWEGDVFIDTTTGRYYGCKIVAAKELTNHEGDGTLFNYRSEYQESMQQTK